VTLPASDHIHAVAWGYAGAIGGMYVICIWGVTQMGVVQMSFVFLVIKALTYIKHAFKKGGLQLVFLHHRHERIRHKRLSSD
jgi:hypothetical protein